MKTRHLQIYILLILVLSGCGKAEQPVTPELPPSRVVQVQTFQVEPRNLVEEFTLPGSLEAWQDLLLAAEVAGPVDSISVEEGGRVEQGRELVRIDSLTLQAHRDSARAEYDLRQKTAERLELLVAEQLVSLQEVDNAVSARDIARANLRTADLMLAKGVLKSPLRGVLEERFVEPGEYIGVGDPLVRLVQIDRLKINVDVPEKDVQYLKKGASVALEIAKVNESGVGMRTGRITHVGYVADPLTRTYPVRIEMDNRDEKLRPGMIVRARFVRRHLDKVLVVPLYAVVERNEQKFLYLREGDKAHQQPVKLGATLSGEIVVIEGLKSGDEVIVKGQQLLIDNALIRIEEKP